MHSAGSRWVVDWHVVLHELGIELFLLQLREFLLELVLYTSKMKKQTTKDVVQSAMNRHLA